MAYLWWRCCEQVKKKKEEMNLEERINKAVFEIQSKNVLSCHYLTIICIIFIASYAGHKNVTYC